MVSQNVYILNLAFSVPLESLKGFLYGSEKRGFTYKEEAGRKEGSRKEGRKQEGRKEAGRKEEGRKKEAGRKEGSRKEGRKEAGKGGRRVCSISGKGGRWSMVVGGLILDPRIPLLRKGLLTSPGGVVDGGRWWSLDPRVSHPLATQGFAASPGGVVDGGRWWSIDPRVSLPLATQGFAASPGWMVDGGQ